MTREEAIGAIVAGLEDATDDVRREDRMPLGTSEQRAAGRGAMESYVRTLNLGKVIASEHTPAELRGMVRIAARDDARKTLAAGRPS